MTTVFQGGKKISKTKGTQGKGPEDKVKEYLDKVATRYVKFDFERVLDARAARGKFPARPGDFAYFGYAPDSGGRAGLIEVKETTHATRLPAKNFDKGKIARLYKRELAGVFVWVLVYHSSTGQWRSIPFSEFRDKPDAVSWDLANYQESADVRTCMQWGAQWPWAI